MPCFFCGEDPFADALERYGVDVADEGGGTKAFQ